MCYMTKIKLFSSRSSNELYQPQLYNLLGPGLKWGKIFPLISIYVSLKYSFCISPLCVKYKISLYMYDSAKLFHVVCGSRQIKCTSHPNAFCVSLSTRLSALHLLTSLRLCLTPIASTLARFSWFPCLSSIFDCTWAKELHVICCISKPDCFSIST